MRNIASYNDFVFEAEKPETTPSQEHINAQKEFSAKIEDLTKSLKKALDDKDTPPIEINKIKITLKIAKLEQELEKANYELTAIEGKTEVKD
jgi:hypothetical protein